ncbi:MAG TPA: lysylphosphatidylglycerol synthase domain-containing protein [Acidimicrobiales bacterium]
MTTLPDHADETAGGGGDAGGGGAAGGGGDQSAGTGESDLPAGSSRKRRRLTVTEARRLLAHLHLTPLTVGIAVVTLLILVAAVLHTTHVPAYLVNHHVGWWGFGAAAVVAVGQYVGYAVALASASATPLPRLRTLELEIAESLTAMATPESMGSFALTIRYLMKQGLNSADAAAVSGLSGFVTTALALCILPVAAIFAAHSVNVAQLQQDVPSSLWEIVLGVIVVAVAVSVAIKVPRLRHRAAAWARGSASYMRILVGHPLRTLWIGAGELITIASQTACLALFVHAFSNQWTSVAALVVITQLAGAASNIVPVPGGLGAPEAILAAGLASVGVPHQEVLVIAICYRMAVYWLPPIPGSLLLYNLYQLQLV